MFNFLDKYLALIVLILPVLIVSPIFIFIFVIPVILGILLVFFSKDIHVLSREWLGFWICVVLVYGVGAYTMKSEEIGWGLIVLLFYFGLVVYFFIKYTMGFFVKKK